MPLFLLPLIVLAVPLGLCAAGFWIWMLVDCLNNRTLNGSQRCCWATFILFTHLVGALAYYFAGRSPQTTPVVPMYPTPHEPRRDRVQPEWDHRPYQEGYPIQHFHQNEQASSEPTPVEREPMQSQARYEDIQMAAPEDPH